MLSHSGFCAWIMCEGKEIKEYESTVDSTGKKVICWIPSEAGKTFSVHWADQGTNVDSATYIKLDGFTVPGRFLFGKGQAQRSGVRVGDDSERPFQFSRVDEVTSSGQAGYTNNPEVGTIVVKIKLVLRNGRRQPNELQTIPPPARGTRQPDETCISFAEECKTYMQTPDTWSFEPYDKSGPSTHAAFVFRYRSRQFLINQHIMSKSDPVYKSTSPSFTLFSQPPTPASTTISLPVTPISNPQSPFSGSGFQLHPHGSPIELASPYPEVAYSQQSTGYSYHSAPNYLQQDSDVKQHPDQAFRNGSSFQTPGTQTNNQFPRVAPPAISHGVRPWQVAQPGTGMFRVSRTILHDEQLREQLSRSLSSNWSSLPVEDETERVINAQRKYGSNARKIRT